MPLGVDTIIIFEVFEDETTGNTDCKNSASQLCLRKPNSSSINTLIDPSTS